MANPTQIVIDAATNAVANFKQIQTLKAQLIQNPTTVADQTHNATINAQIRTESKKLKDNNTILKANKIDALLPATKLDENGDVIAPWNFSNTIVGTSQYTTVQTGYDDVSSQTELTDSQTSQIDTLTATYQSLSTYDINLSQNNINMTEAFNILLYQQNPDQAQNIRQNLEDDLREANDNLTESQKQLGNISKQIQAASSSELEGLMQQLATEQANYESLLKTQKTAQSLLNEFLKTNVATQTKPTQRTETTNSNLTDDEQRAVKTLKRQFVDIMNTTDSREERDEAFENIKKLDAAIKENRITKSSLSSPNYTQLQDFNTELTNLVNERNNLQEELSNTDPSNIAKIAELTLALEENATNRYQLSLQIIGLQDNLGFGIKVKLSENELTKQPELLIYNTVNATYNTNDVYLTDLVGNNDIVNESKGLLNNREFEQLKFVTATQVYDAKTGRVIPRSEAQTGQEGRYTNVRPFLPDGDEFKNSQGLTPRDEYVNSIQLEIKKLEEDYLKSEEYLSYKAFDNAVYSEYYNTYVAPLKETRDNILLEMKDTFLQMGLSDEEASQLVNAQESVSTEEFVTLLNKALEGVE